MKLLGAHQNIVSLVGCCTLQEHKFLVIEYVPFGNLLQWLRRRRRSVRHLRNGILILMNFTATLFLKDSYLVLQEIACGNYVHGAIANLREARWRHGSCARLRIERSRLEPWPGTLSCVLSRKTLNSLSASLHPGVLMGTGKFNAGSNPAMD